MMKKSLQICTLSLLALSGAGLVSANGQYKFNADLNKTVVSGGCSIDVTGSAIVSNKTMGNCRVNASANRTTNEGRVESGSRTEPGQGVRTSVQRFVKAGKSYTATVYAACFSLDSGKWVTERKTFRGSCPSQVFTKSCAEGGYYFDANGNKIHC